MDRHIPINCPEIVLFSFIAKCSIGICSQSLGKPPFVIIPYRTILISLDTTYYSCRNPPVFALTLAMVNFFSIDSFDNSVPNPPPINPKGTETSPVTMVEIEPVALNSF